MSPEASATAGEPEEVHTRGAAVALAIHLRSIGGQYVVAENAGGSEVNANRAAAQGWETFQLIDHNGGSLVSGDRVSLRTDDGRHYVAAEHNGGGNVNAHGKVVGPWETFTIFKRTPSMIPFGRAPIGAGNKVSFRTFDGRHYLGAEHGGGGTVNAHGTRMLEWETFTLEFAATKVVRQPPPQPTAKQPTAKKPQARPAPSPAKQPTRPTPLPTAATASKTPAPARRVHLRSHGGQYVVAENAGGSEVNANRAAAQGWETFQLIDQNGGSLVSGDRVSLRTDDGRHYVAAENNGGGNVNALGKAIGPWETFTILKPAGPGLYARPSIGAGDKVSFRTADGRHFLAAEHGGGGTVNAHGTQPREWETFTLEDADAPKPKPAVGTHPAPDRIADTPKRRPAPAPSQPTKTTASHAPTQPPRAAGVQPARPGAPQRPTPVAGNRCVEDVPAAFERLQSWGDRLGVWIGDWRPHPKDHRPIDGKGRKFLKSAVKGSIKQVSKTIVKNQQPPGGPIRKKYLDDWNEARSDARAAAKEEFTNISHMQGIQRLPGAHLAISASSVHDRVGHVFIAELRQTSDDGRFQSNLLGGDPPPSDAVVHRLDLEVIDAFADTPGFRRLGAGERYTGDPDRHYNHAGGLQVIGDYAAIGLGHGADGELGRVVFYDLAAPTDPRKLPYELWVPRSNSVGIAREADRRYVLVVRLDKRTLHLYRSKNTDLEDPVFQGPDEWNLERHGLHPDSIDDKWRNYQNINFVRDCSGPLYLVGFSTKKGGIGGEDPTKGDDWADLYRIEFGSPYADYDFLPEKVAAKKIHCDKYCKFAAGGGIHVNDRGELVLYGVKHFTSDKRIRVNEFRSSPDPGSVVSNLDDAWVTVYGRKDYEGRSLGLDRADPRNGQWRNYADLRFDNEPDSVRWALPRGWRYGLYQRPEFRGTAIWLMGSGSVSAIPELSPSKVSSSQFLRNTIQSPRDGWIELYGKEQFEGRMMTSRVSYGYQRSRGRSTRAAMNGGIRDYKRLRGVDGKDGFNDNVASVRYQLTRGQVYRLYQHRDYGGDFLDLVGDGTIREIPAFTDGQRELKDKISSSRFVRGE